jgi:hypothetical protein
MPDATPPFIATIGYVRSLKIGHLTVWCYGKREGGWTCQLLVLHNHGFRIIADGALEGTPIMFRLFWVDTN